MKKIAVLCDFDGTVAQDDVGNLLFRTFSRNGDSLEVVERWKRGEISLARVPGAGGRAGQLLPGRAAQLHPGPAARPLLQGFPRLRPPARHGSGGAQRRARLLHRADAGPHGLGAVEFYANRMRHQGTSLRVSFPGTTCSPARTAAAARPPPVPLPQPGLLHRVRGQRPLRPLSVRERRSRVRERGVAGALPREEHRVRGIQELPGRGARGAAAPGPQRRTPRAAGA